MRHVPTSLYIDTEVFNRNGLRLDTSEFRLLKETFVKGGLRLLIPKMMERELFRHYGAKAKETAEKLARAHRAHPVEYLSLADLPTQEELEEMCRNELRRQWEEFKGHFVVEQLPLVGSLEDVVNWYFSIRAPFTKKKPKEFPDAFILSALEHYHQEHKASIAVVSADGDFSKARMRRPYIEYYENLEKYVEAFKPALTSDDLISEPIDPTQPIVTEDLTEIKAILGRGSNVTPIEVGRALKLLRSRGENYRYFFLNSNDPIWLDRLEQEGYFKDPPNVVVSADGHVQYPFWPELQYLKNVCKEAPEEVIQLVLQLPAVDNPRVYESILDMALELDGEQSARLKPRMLEYARLERQFLAFQYSELLAHWTAEDQTEAALELANMLVQFAPDPQAEEKQRQRREIHEDQATSVKDQMASMMAVLNPAPRFNDNYQEILNEGVRPLAEREPYRVALMLMDATATMIRLGKHEEDLESGTSVDLLESRCPRLNQPRHDYPDSRETLVHTLTDACEKVYEQASEAIEALDNALRNQRWDVFKRLRQHLYALHPSEQTRPWIRELILAHGDYAKRKHRYEFQRMIRLACEHFGVELLTEDERTRIFDRILSGPSRDDFREWMGEQFTETDFERRRRYFHRQQLRPFATVLFGKYAGYFQELKDDETAEEITDASYWPVSESEEGGIVISRSPRSLDELSKLPDEELLDYINEWQDTQLDRADGLTWITIDALSGAFQTVFKDSIIPNAGRLSFWIENRDNIHRPIYVRAMIDAMQENVKAKNFDKLDEWFPFCEWVLLHPDSEFEEGVRSGLFRDESPESPNWHSSRRAVCEFIGACLKPDVDVPLLFRGQLQRLLEMLCTQSDWRLDHDRRTLLDRDNPFAEAINTTRGRALENLVNFGLWVRRHDDRADVPEVKAILEKRFGSEAEFPLTIPEYAMLGRFYSWIFGLDGTWATARKSVFFPRNHMPAWREAFGNYLRWSRPYEPIYDGLFDNFEFALEHLDCLKQQMDSAQRSADDFLGQHLFTYYLWNVYPLKGDHSLIERFYLKTEGERKHWARLFGHIGSTLRNTGKHLDEGLKDRIVTFFEWRLETGDPSELQEFVFWLEAECLDAEWRLNAYSRILDLLRSLGVDPWTDQSAHTSSHAIDSMREMLPMYAGGVVECFAKLIDSMPESGVIYVGTDDAKAILKAGLDHDDESVRENALQARESLLKRGYFSVLD